MNIVYRILAAFCFVTALVSLVMDKPWEYGMLLNILGFVLLNNVELEEIKGKLNDK